MSYISPICNNLTVHGLLQYQTFCPYRVWWAFAELRKATISFVMSLRLSARNNSDPTGGIFMEIIFEDFSKFSTRFKIHSNLSRIVLYMKTNKHFLIVSRTVLLEWKLFQTDVVEKIKTHILRSQLLSENYAVCKIMSKSIQYSQTGLRWK